ncbi:MAG: hypothetical protein FRX49_02620 [Trebouxia sp. A1-2]|nr:MAG: hypothetical protein FRX49_02620 [Trebouxia sp. A1-2]
MPPSTALVDRALGCIASPHLQNVSRHPQTNFSRCPPRLQSPVHNHGMSTCVSLVAALGFQLLIQPPSLAQMLPVAQQGTPKIEQTTAIQQPGSNVVLLTFGHLSAPNLIVSLSQDDAIPNQPPASSNEPLSAPQFSIPSQPDTQGPPSTSSSPPETGPSGPPPAPLPTPPVPEDPQKTEEEQRKSLRKTRRSRIKELEDTRLELAEKQLKLIEREKELLDKDQTVSTLREELDLERKLRALLTKEKDKAEEEAALAMGLCTGAFTLP